MDYNNISRNIFDQAPLQDLKTIPQSADILAKESSAISQTSFANYKLDFFVIWHSAINDYQHFLPLPEKIGLYDAIFARHNIEQLVTNANMQSLGQVSQKGLITSNSNLRNLPTLMPSYHHPFLPGQGHPFDNIQENLLRIGEPILISHYSLDKKFAYVITNAKICGFVRVEDIAYLSDLLAAEIMSKDFAMIVNDNSTVTYKQTYVTTLELGCFLPTENNQLLLPIKTLSAQVQLIAITTKAENYITTPYEKKLLNIKPLINKLINQPYGWGGYLRLRDCAQLVKDYFALFGHHLPIFSAQQSLSGKQIALSEPKIDLIKTLPPYFSLLYCPGHIVIYLGLYQNSPIVFHAVWGMSLFHQNQEYRYIIGKSVLTSLTYGSELAGYEQQYSLIGKLSKAIII
jgi:SH3 domain (SH3b1 type)/NlpC/P60 family